jgi:HEPN domain-containing protein
MRQHPADLAATWLAQATHDLEDARYLAERGSHALKAYLVFKDGDKARTHRIADLLKTATTCDASLSPSLMDAAGLDPYYVSTRYPDAIGGALPADSFYGAESEKAIERAARVLDAVSTRLPKP